MPDEDDTPEAPRTDAAGFDTQPPPSPLHQPGHPGLQDQPAPEREGWREFGSDAKWTGPDAYPAETEAEAEADDTTTADLPTPAEDPDLLAAVTTAIEGDATLDIAELSVERRGDTIFLRGSAATPEDRHRAGDLAAACPGVGHVENLLGAGDGADIGRLAKEEQPEEFIDPTSDA